MAQVVVTKAAVICDRPGCEKHVTEKGGRVHFMVDGEGRMTVEVHKCPEPEMKGIDLCREDLASFEKWWKSKEEP